MTYLDLPQGSQPRVSPQLLVGAASPLWTYFGAAAAGGVAFWWMTRWARPVNLEALLGRPGAFEAIVEEAVEVAEAVVEEVEPLPDVIAEAGVEAEAAVAAEPEPFAEAAPFVEAVAPEPEAEAEPPLAPEPAVEFEAIESEPDLPAAVEPAAVADVEPVVEAEPPSTIEADPFTEATPEMAAPAPLPQSSRRTARRRLTAWRSARPGGRTGAC